MAIDELNQAAALYKAYPRLRAEVLDTLGMHFAKYGNLPRAHQYYTKSIALKRTLPASSNRYGLALTYGNLGRLELSREEYEAAERWFRQDLEMVLAGPPSPNIEAMVRDELGVALLGQGARRLVEARAELARALELASETSGTRISVLCNLARTELLAGDLASAEQRLVTARPIAQREGFAELALSLLAVEADLFGARAENRDDRAATRAIAAYDEAQAGFERLGLPHETCAVVLARGALLARLGRREEALGLLMGVALPIAERFLFAQMQPLARLEAAIEALSPETLLRIRVRRLLGGLPPDQHGARLRGIRHRVTVWTCDIRGFTRFCETTGDPRIVVEMLNRFFAALGQRILDGGGRIDKYVGDNILAYFREPASAAGVALAALEAMARLNAEREHLEERPLSIGIGLATGDIVEGNVGFAGRLEHTIIGTPVNLACRLVGEADGGEILLDVQTREALGKTFVTRPAGRGTKELHGLGKVRVYRLERRVGAKGR